VGTRSKPCPGLPNWALVRVLRTFRHDLGRIDLLLGSGRAADAVSHVRFHGTWLGEAEGQQGENETVANESSHVHLSFPLLIQAAGGPAGTARALFYSTPNVEMRKSR